eukprot:CAMPEP_0177649070 /NCGR_PEP_ID=MMETSP0447-20121125/11171_1 /TAXON_ID=0 /ORGANISM="Stygamoeba regulata, Strain BSH-02190019" /LENGTH=470 /DNA_ID=CAMNT_0019151765 /DNA_START=164 /DNA_END=1576 /DNA_ORIENTATION=+
MASTPISQVLNRLYYESGRESEAKVRLGKLMCVSHEEVGNLTIGDIASSGKLDLVTPIGLRNNLKKIIGDGFKLPSPVHKLKVPAGSPATLRQIVVMTRHGARFPISPFPGNQNWPGDIPDFWKQYKGTLTPQGVEDHLRNGSQLKEYYFDYCKLTDPYGLLSDTCYIRSTNTQRTILSAWSLLLTLFPHGKIRIQIDGDKTTQKWKDDESSTIDDATLTIRVQFDKGKDVTKLKTHKTDEFKELHEKNANNDPKLNAWANDPWVVKLMDKAYEMTKEPKLAPDLKAIDRIKKIYKVNTNMTIDEYHNMVTLRNDRNLYLDAKEVLAIKEMAEHCWRLKWTGCMDDMQVQIARRGTREAMSLITKFHDNYVDRKKFPFVYLSNHDGYIAAALSAMNYKDWQVPGFGCYIIWELHEISPGRFAIGVRHNPLPREIPFRHCQLKKIPSRVTPWDEVEEGMISLEEYKQILAS